MSDALQAQTGTLARALQVVLAVEIAGMALAAFWLARSGAPAGAIAALLLGYFLGLRAILVSKNFWGGEHYKSAREIEHQIGLAGALRLWWGEYRITVVTYSVLFPFERWLVPLAPAAAATGEGTPIVLVPGFACNRGYWFFFARWLARAQKAPVYAVTLEPVLGGIDDNAKHLGAFLEKICEASGAHKVLIVAHSMGGLVARAWLHAAKGEARIAKIITLGSPHHGTRLAHDLRKVGHNLNEMCRDSRWCAALNDGQTRPCPVPITAIISPHDNIVFPQDSAVLKYPNARNLFVPGVGHLEMVASKAVLKLVLEEMKYPA